MVHRASALTAILPVLWDHPAASPGMEKQEKRYLLIETYPYKQYGQNSHKTPHGGFGHEISCQRQHGFTTHFHEGHVSRKAPSVTELCPNCFGYAHRHTRSIGMVYFLIHEGVMQYTYSSRSSRKSQVGKFSFQFYLQSCTNLLPISLETTLDKNQKQSQKEPSGEARINTQERHKRHNPERQIYISIIKASLCLLVLSLISSKGFAIGLHFWIPNHCTTLELQLRDTVQHLTNSTEPKRSKEN